MDAEDITDEFDFDPGLWGEDPLDWDTMDASPTWLVESGSESSGVLDDDRTDPRPPPCGGDVRVETQRSLTPVAVRSDTSWCSLSSASHRAVQPADDASAGSLEEPSDEWSSDLWPKDVRVVTQPSLDPVPLVALPEGIEDEIVVEAPGETASLSLVVDAEACSSIDLAAETSPSLEPVDLPEPLLLEDLLEDEPEPFAELPSEGVVVEAEIVVEAEPAPDDEALAEDDVAWEDEVLDDDVAWEDEVLDDEVLDDDDDAELLDDAEMLDDAEILDAVDDEEALPSLELDLPTAPALKDFAVQVRVPEAPEVTRRGKLAPTAAAMGWSSPFRREPVAPTIRPPLGYAPWPSLRDEPSDRAVGRYQGTSATGAAVEAARRLFGPMVREGAIPAPTQVGLVQRALSIVGEDGAFAELAEVVGQDPSLTSVFLRFANASDAAAPVGSVREAVVRIGMQGARDALRIAYSRSVVRVPGRERLTRGLQARSAAVASAAGALVGVSSVPGMPSEEDALTAGALHDVGRAAVHALLRRRGVRLPPELSAARTWDRVADGLHGEIGWELAVVWGLDVELAGAIGHHHAPEHAPGRGDLARLVAAACAIVDHVGIEPEGPRIHPLRHPAVIPYGLGPVGLKEVLRRVRSRLTV